VCVVSNTVNSEFYKISISDIVYVYVMLYVVQENFVKMLTAECQLERFLLENPPNEKNVEKAAVELPSVQQELLKVATTHPKVHHSLKFLIQYWYTNNILCVQG